MSKNKNKNKNKKKNNFIASRIVPSKNLPLDNAKNVELLSVTTSGPLPNPEILKRYDEISPGAAKIIIERAEKQSDHRMELEKRVISSDINNSKIGLWAGFIISMTVIIGGFILVFNDKSVEGLTAIIVALASLAGVFIYGNKERRDERERKNKKNVIN